MRAAGEGLVEQQGACLHTRTRVGCQLPHAGMIRVFSLVVSRTSLNKAKFKKGKHCALPECVLDFNHFC